MLNVKLIFYYQVRQERVAIFLQEMNRTTEK